MRSGEIRKAQKARSASVDGCAHRLSFVRPEVVENDDVVALERGDRELLAIDGSVKQAGRFDPVVTERRQEGRGLPMMGWTPPTASVCQTAGVESHQREASVSEVSTIGLDLAKNVFQAHGASSSGEVIFRRRLRREQVMTFFADQPPCLVAMEACGSSHFWARAISELGHGVRLIPPAYVKPFVKRQKNDMADAEAICEAVQRPTMRFVAVQSEAKQASAVIFRTRDLLVGQRTQIINALRGHMGE